MALAAVRDKAPLQFFADGSAAGGKSTLVRDGDAGTVTSKISAKNLSPGAVYTYWYVIFNNPELCSDGLCGEDDIFIGGNPENGPNVAQIEAVGIAALGGNGEIANRGGNATFTGGLIEGTTGGLNVLLGPGGLIDLGPGMLRVGNAMTAEIHIVLRNHGPPLTGADLWEQLNTFVGNCIGFDADGTFQCMDEQFAIHLP